MGTKENQLFFLFKGGLWKDEEREQKKWENEINKEVEPL